MDKGEMWTKILELGLVSEETLQVVTDVAGYSEETLDAVVYSVTGYQSLEQLLEEV